MRTDIIMLHSLAAIKNIAFAYTDKYHIQIIARSSLRDTFAV